VITPPQQSPRALRSRPLTQTTAIGADLGHGDYDVIRHPGPQASRLEHAGYDPQSEDEDRCEREPRQDSIRDAGRHRLNGSRRSVKTALRRPAAA
jgi:hypothetical protein